MHWFSKPALAYITFAYISLARLSHVAMAELNWQVFLQGGASQKLPQSKPVGEQKSNLPQPPSNILSCFPESPEARGPSLINFVMLVKKNIYEYRKGMYTYACMYMCVYIHIHMHARMYLNITATFFVLRFTFLTLIIKTHCLLSPVFIVYSVVGTVEHTVNISLLLRSVHF